MAGQLCEAFLDWFSITTEAAVLLAVGAGSVYVMALFYAKHLS
jgi:hypothetical protein